MVRAVALAAPDDPRAGVLRDALLRLGEGDGWGTTNANAAADRRAGRRLAAAAIADRRHADARLERADARSRSTPTLPSRAM